MHTFILFESGHSPNIQIIGFFKSDMDSKRPTRIEQISCKSRCLILIQNRCNSYLEVFVLHITDTTLILLYQDTKSYNVNFQSPIQQSTRQKSCSAQSDFRTKLQKSIMNISTMSLSESPSLNHYLPVQYQNMPRSTLQGNTTTFLDQFLFQEYQGK